MRIISVFLLFGMITAGTGVHLVRADPVFLPHTAGVGADTTSSDSGIRRDGREELKQKMARIGGSEVPGTPESKQKKSPTIAMISSMVLPGLGQLYNERRYKTIIAFGAFTYYFGTAWFEHKKSEGYLNERDSYPEDSVGWYNANLLYEFHKENAITFLWWSGAVWLLSVLDAFVDAHLYDVRTATPSVQRGTDGTKYLSLSIGF